MSDMRISEIVQQMQAVAARAGGAGVATGEDLLPGAGAPTDFGALLKASINAVNDTQQAAGQKVQRFEVGDPQMELGEVMVALQKADISFKAMTEVRNKLVDAYKDIMNMPI